MPSLLTSFDLVGTFVFALSGALVAARKDFDVVGVFVLSLAAGLGGGAIRDVLINDLPPAAVENESYLVAVLAAATVAYVIPERIERINYSVRYLDALGLGFFAVVGSQKAVDADLGFIAALLVGVIAAAGGGVIRDLLASTTPLLLHQDIYALAALLGSVAFLAASEFGLPYAPAAILGVAATFLLRAAAIRYHLHAPRPRRQRKR